jgi:YihY family inner membrane protein
MSMSKAVRLCPALVIVPPDFARYRAASNAIFGIFREVTPLVEPLSLDEAYLDVTENAWGVPKAAERGFVGSRLRAIALLVVLGGLAVVSTVVSGLAAGGADFVGAGGKVLGLVIATVLNLFVFGAVFRLLTADTVETRALIPGVVVATIGWEVLQVIGGWYISHEVKNASAVYGTFALVIGLLAWIHLGATFVVLGAETNVVRTRKLWPRSMFGSPGSGT